MQETLVKTSHVILNLISIFLRVNLNSASVQKAAAHLRTHVVENTEQASLLRTGRDVAEIIRSLDFTVPEACGGTGAPPETQRGAVSASAGERH